MKLRSIKACFICLKILFSSDLGKISLDLYDVLLICLKEAAKLSKDQKNDVFFVDESLSSNLLEYLALFSQEIYPKEESENKLEMVNLMIIVLKNNAANQGVRTKFFETKNLEILSFFFHYFAFDEKTTTEIENCTKNTDLDKRLR